MKKEIVFIALASVIIYLPAISAHAEGGVTEEEIENAEQILNEYCNEVPQILSKHFDGLKADVQNIRKRFCNLDVDIDELTDEVLPALGRHKSVSLLEGKLFKVPFELKTKPLTDEQFERFSFVPLLNEISLNPMATYNVTQYSATRIEVKYDNSFQMQLDLAKCNDITSIDCKKYFKDFKSAYNHAQRTYSTPLAEEVYKVYKSAEKDWNAYFENARSQMPWEYYINYEAWVNSKRVGRVGHPLDYQWILFHPSIVIENVSDAVDGENTKEALMIELAGVNFWRDKEWYEPSGVSLVSLYADRAQTKDWGWGAAIHFGNDLTVGWSKHDDENGVFVSIDLWKLFSNKKAKYDSFRQKYLRQ